MRGGSSQKNAKGSLLSAIGAPLADAIRYLYAWPQRAAATKASQMPEPSQRGCSGSALPSQPFQSPITDTVRAFGAQTAKCAPSPPVTG